MNSAMDRFKKQLALAVAKARRDELSKVTVGIQNSAGIRTPEAGARYLTIDDYWHYREKRAKQLEKEIRQIEGSINGLKENKSS